MNETTVPNADIFDLLAKTWQPVALSRDVADDDIVPVTLLDHDIVIARLPDGLLAARNHCPHRGARFDIGDIHQGELRCPYHGWRFDQSGSCTTIPSLPSQSHSARKHACLTTYAVQERYGMIWVRLSDQEAAPLPDIPEYESDEWEYVVADPMLFGTGFRREIDNYLDMSHFAFAHATTLGVAAKHVIEDIRISHYRDGLQMDAPFPALSAPDVKPTKLQQPHHRQQRVYLPNFTTIRQSFHDGDERVLVHIPSPISEHSCNVFWALAISKNFDGPPIAQQIEFAINVLDEDRIMVENQRPLEVPLGPEPGVTVPADRLAMAYKRAFREFVAAGGVRPEAEDLALSGKAGEATVAICWGSQTGNAERLASALSFACAHNGVQTDVIDLALMSPLDLRDYEHVALITSTYGSGEAPDNAQAFLRSLQQLQNNELQDVGFAVLGLGDRSYPDFCQCAKDFDAALDAAGAQRLCQRVDCDVDYDADFNQWTTTFLQTLKPEADLTASQLSEAAPPSSRSSQELTFRLLEKSASIPKAARKPGGIAYRAPSTPPTSQAICAPYGQPTIGARSVNASG